MRIFKNLITFKIWSFENIQYFVVSEMTSNNQKSYSGGESQLKIYCIYLKNKASLKNKLKKKRPRNFCYTSYKNDCFSAFKSSKIGFCIEIDEACGPRLNIELCKIKHWQNKGVFGRSHLSTTFWRLLFSDSKLNYYLVNWLY